MVHLVNSAAEFGGIEPIHQKGPRARAVLRTNWRSLAAALPMDKARAPSARARASATAATRAAAFLYQFSAARPLSLAARTVANHFRALARDAPAAAAALRAAAQPGGSLGAGRVAGRRVARERGRLPICRIARGRDSIATALGTQTVEPCLSAPRLPPPQAAAALHAATAMPLVKRSSFSRLLRRRPLIAIVGPHAKHNGTGAHRVLLRRVST